MGLERLWLLVVDAAPDSALLVDGARRLAAGECAERVRRLANGLRDLDVGPGDRVAVFTTNCAESVEIPLAIALLGAVSVPVNYRLTSGEVAYILQDAQAKVAIASAPVVDVAVDALLSCPDVAVKLLLGGNNAALPTGWLDYDVVMNGASADTPAEPTTPAASLTYTSGTTGKPKGAVRGSVAPGGRALQSFIMAVGATSRDVHLVCAPLYHAAPMGLVTLHMLSGATVVVMEHFDAERALRLMAEEGVTTTFMVPTMLDRIRRLPAATKKRWKFPKLRQIICSAAPLSSGTKQATLEFFGDVLYEMYGGTEMGFVTCISSEEMRAKPGSVGKPFDGCEVRLLGTDGQEVASGEIGEVHVRSDLLAKGYYNNPDATAKSFRDGCVTLGDMAFTDSDGYLYLVDRAVDMVISGGVNIYPKEIEDTLYEHPEVVEAAVIGIPNEAWGEELVAFIVLEDDKLADTDALRAYCRSHLADFKVPRTFQFTDALPRNATGKVLKRQLRERVEAQSGSAK